MDFETNVVEMKESVKIETTQDQLSRLTLDNRQLVTLYIQAYHYQITRGCLLPNCTNKYCATNIKPKLKDEDVAKLSVELAKKSLTTKEHSFCECKNPLFPYTTHSGGIGVQYEYLKATLDSCTKSGDYSKLTQELGSVFGVSDSLNHSFFTRKAYLALESDADPSLDMDSLASFYQQLDALKNENINKKMKESFANLLSSLEKDKKKISKPLHLRQIEILFESPQMMDPTYHNILSDLTKVVLELPLELKNVLKSWFQNYSLERFRRLISLYHQFITIQLYQRGIIDEKISYATRVLGLLNATNDARPKKLRAGFSEFYNDAVNNIVDMGFDYKRWMKSRSGQERTSGFASFSFCNHPFILDANSKSNVLKVDSELKQSSRMRQTLTQSLMSTGSVSLQNLFYVLKVDRNNLVETTLNGLVGVDPLDYKKQLRVMFQGEEGVDEGGVKKEFFQLLIKQLFDVNYGMFTYNEEYNYYWFNPNSLEAGNTFMLFGILLGLAIYNSVILDVHFPMVVYKKLLEKEVNFGDLVDFDPALANGLKQLLEFDGDVENTFMRTFQVETESFGVKSLVDLKLNGGKIPVTSENRKEYVDLMVQWVLINSIAHQFRYFKKGFDAVCKGPPLELFKYEELELMIVGSSVLDFDALERATIYAEGYKKDDEYIKQFWSVVKSLSEDEKKKFLFFSTGSDRAPINGLGSMEFIIMKHGSCSQLPTSHTCFNHFLLPKYDSKEQLEQKLKLAISNSEGFGLM